MINNYTIYYDILDKGNIVIISNDIIYYISHIHNSLKLNL